MAKGNDRLNALIENSQKVGAYDFSHLERTQDKALVAKSPTKLTGSKMTKRTKRSSEQRVNYTFAL